MLWQSAALPVQRIQPHCGHVFQEQPETDARAGQPPHHLLALLCRAGKAGSKAPQQQLSALWSLRDSLRRPTCALLADLMVTLLEQSEEAALKDLLANRCAHPCASRGGQEPAAGSRVLGCLHDSASRGHGIVEGDAVSSADH